MGLDVSHGAFRGSYGGFAGFREAVFVAAGCFFLPEVWVCSPAVATASAVSGSKAFQALVAIESSRQYKAVLPKQY
jgi:hypothetical protein